MIVLIALFGIYLSSEMGYLTPRMLILGIKPLIKSLMH
jgi:hypothetical protein